MTMPITDALAVERTRLANERTLLAYIRTALSLLGVGAGLLQFTDTRPLAIAGWLLLLSGAVVLPVGAWRYMQVRRSLAAIR